MQHVHGALLLYTVVQCDWLEKMNALVCRNWTSCMDHYFYLKEQLMDTVVIIHTWVFHGHFLELEQSKSITIASDKIQVFKRKSEFWKICISQTFLMRLMVKLTECAFSTLCEMPVFGSSAWVSEGLLFKIASG